MPTVVFESFERKVTSDISFMTFSQNNSSLAILWFWRTTLFGRVTFILFEGFVCKCSRCWRFLYPPLWLSGSRYMLHAFFPNCCDLLFRSRGKVLEGLGTDLEMKCWIKYKYSFNCLLHDYRGYPRIKLDILPADNQSMLLLMSKSLFRKWKLYPHKTIKDSKGASFFPLLVREECAGKERNIRVKWERKGRRRQFNSMFVASFFSLTLFSSRM